MWDLFGTKGGGFRDLEPGVLGNASRSRRLCLGPTEPPSMQKPIELPY